MPLLVINSKLCTFEINYAIPVYFSIISENTILFDEHVIESYDMYSITWPNTKFVKSKLIGEHFMRGGKGQTLAFRMCSRVRKYTLQKKVTHNILVYRQVQIIVAVTCILYISYVIEYKEWNFEGFW